MKATIKELLVVAGGAFTFVLTIFGAGKSYGKLVPKKDCEKITEQIYNRINTIQLIVENKMDTIHSEITTRLNSTSTEITGRIDKVVETVNEKMEYISAEGNRIQTENYNMFLAINKAVSKIEGQISK